jgi:hypothetical protein
MTQVKVRVPKAFPSSLVTRRQGTSIAASERERAKGVFWSPFRGLLRVSKRPQRALTIL